MEKLKSDTIFVERWNKLGEVGMDLEVKTRVIKRNGEEVDFRLEKIVNAIKKANEEVENIHRMNDFQIIAIAEKIAQQAEELRMQ